MAQGRRGTRGREAEAPVEAARTSARALERLQKRDGRIVPFQRAKIADAVLKAYPAGNAAEPVCNR